MLRQTQRVVFQSGDIDVIGIMHLPYGKGFAVIADAGHYELYGKPEYVDQAADQVGAFFDGCL